MSGVSRSTWTARARIALALASLGGLAVAAAGPGQSEQARTARPTDRGMFVSVLDKDGAPVTGLTAADFVVREDRVAREVLRAERATDPITLPLVIDNSQAATPFIPDIRLALKAFVKRLAGRNPMAVTVFGERPSIFTDYTLDAASVEKGVERLFGVGWQRLLLDPGGRRGREGARQAGLRTRRHRGHHGRRAGVHGPLLRGLIPRLRDSGAAFYALVIAPTPPNLSDYGQRNREMFVDAAARATGGNRSRCSAAWRWPPRSTASPTSSRASTGSPTGGRRH